MTHFTEYAGRISHCETDGPDVAHTSVTLQELDAQKDQGWPDWHPETFCHRCGNRNTPWTTTTETWDPVMRYAGGQPWQGIVCIPCFTELAENLRGHCTWRITRHPEYGTTQLWREGD